VDEPENWASKLVPEVGIRSSNGRQSSPVQGIKKPAGQYALNIALQKTALEVFKQPFPK